MSSTSTCSRARSSPSRWYATSSASTFAPSSGSSPRRCRLRLGPSAQLVAALARRRAGLAGECILWGAYTEKPWLRSVRSNSRRSRESAHPRSGRPPHGTRRADRCRTLSSSASSPARSPSSTTSCVWPRASATSAAIDPGRRPDPAQQITTAVVDVLAPRESRSPIGVPARRPIETTSLRRDAPGTSAHTEESSATSGMHRAPRRVELSPASTRRYAEWMSTPSGCGSAATQGRKTRRPVRTDVESRTRVRPASDDGGGHLADPQSANTAGHPEQSARDASGITCLRAPARAQPSSSSSARGCSGSRLLVELVARPSARSSAMASQATSSTRRDVLAREP